MHMSSKELCPTQDFVPSAAVVRDLAKANAGYIVKESINRGAAVEEFVSRRAKL